MASDSSPAQPGRSRHIGLALWAAAEAWRQRLTAEMAAQGIDWFGEARAALIPHIAADGTRMADLPARSGLSRQAVHQFVAALEAGGILRRESNPEDARGRIVRYTAAGLSVLREADAAKQRIEVELASRLGADRFEALQSALEVLGRAGDDNDTPGSGPTPLRQRRQGRARRGR